MDGGPYRWIGVDWQFTRPKGQAPAKFALAAKNLALGAIKNRAGLSGPARLGNSVYFDRLDTRGCQRLAAELQQAWNALPLAADLDAVLFFLGHSAADELEQLRIILRHPLGEAAANDNRRNVAVGVAFRLELQ